MDGETHLLPEQREYQCVECGNQLIRSTQPYSCPRCEETMTNEAS